MSAVRRRGDLSGLAAMITRKSGGAMETRLPGTPPLAESLLSARQRSRLEISGGGVLRAMTHTEKFETDGPTNWVSNERRCDRPQVGKTHNRDAIAACAPKLQVLL